LPYATTIFLVHEDLGATWHVGQIVLYCLSLNMKKIVGISFCLFYLLVIHAQPPKLVLPVGHTKQVLTAEFNPDGTKLLTHSADGTVKLWETGSGKLLLDFKESGDASRAANVACRFTQDGKKIVLTFGSNDTKIVDANTGDVLWSWLYGQHDVPGKDIMKHISPDGKKILLSDATIYSIQTSKPLVTLKGALGSTFNATFSPDGKRIAAVTEDSTLQIWDAHTAKLLATKKEKEAIESIQYNPDSKSILLITEKSRAKMLDGTTGNVIRQLIKYEEDVVYTDQDNYNHQYIQWPIFSPDGKFLIQLISSGLQLENIPSVERFCEEINSTLGQPLWNFCNVAKVWDIRSGKLLYQIDSLVSFNTDFNFASFFSPDGKKIITPLHNNTVDVRDAFTGKKLYSLVGHTEMITAARFSPNGKLIITTSADSTAKIWNAENGHLLNTLSGHSDVIVDARFSFNSKNIVTTSGDHTASIWDAASATQSVILKGKTKNVSGATFHSDGSKIYFFSDEKKMVLDLHNISLRAFAEQNSHDSITEEKHLHRSGNEDGVDSIDYYKRKDWIVNWGVDIYTVQDGEIGDIIVNNRLDELIENIVFSPDKKQLLFSLFNNTLRLFDIEKEKFIFTFIYIDSSDYIVQMPTGYYQSTPGAAKLLHYVAKNLKPISFEQLDVKYNRPDLVLKAIGISDTVLISSYRNAYVKRIKKLGIDTAAFRDGYSVPEADFVNRNEIASEQKMEKLSLHIKGMDSTYKLDRYNVWVNEVPLYGQRGISIRKINSNSLDKTVEITLSEGENRIETSITNVNGAESYRMPLTVNYSPTVSQKETTYFIGIGIDKFSNASKNLQYSAKDIRDFSAAMQKQFGNNVVIDTLLNENVTADNIKALKKKLLQTKVNDKVIISYSGHGLLSKSFDYYLSTYAVNFDNPEENGLPYDELENLLDSIPARKKLLLIDACHSGEVDKEDVIVINAVADSMHLTKGTTIVGSKEGKGLGLKNSFELMQNLFVNVGKSTGATIISAAAGTQFALEKNDLKNGVFTYCVLEAMTTQANMKVSTLRNTVTTNVQKLTNGLQKPTSRNESINVDWLVW
jgi:WD40 repeat protein